MQIIRTNNHRFYYSCYANNPSLSNNNTDPNFKTTTFRPFIIQKSALCLSEMNRQSHRGSLDGFAQKLTISQYKTTAMLAKWTLCLGAVWLSALFIKSLFVPTPSTSSLSTLERVIQKGRLSWQQPKVTAPSLIMATFNMVLVMTSSIVMLMNWVFVLT
ncbi:hypothetical protein [Moraxella nonliquefaciens]|uniref:hypothetical protein n=1 Tax=Moraxella nonliquefaciens TaxID=478 RepID=UPI003EE3A2AC